LEEYFDDAIVYEKGYTNSKVDEVENPTLMMMIAVKG